MTGQSYHLPRSKMRYLLLKPSLDSRVARPVLRALRPSRKTTAAIRVRRSNTGIYPTRAGKLGGIESVQPTI